MVNRWFFDAELVQLRWEWVAAAAARNAAMPGCRPGVLTYAQFDALETQESAAAAYNRRLRVVCPPELLAG
jgi:S-adenosylmethionine:diacylglycerol 3-amino-3-carboxypropyl transferase